MYRHDYSSSNLSPNTQVANLYDTNYYVINSDFRVYVCIDNGSTGAPGTETAKGENSLDEPIHTDLEPHQSARSTLKTDGESSATLCI